MGRPSSYRPEFVTVAAQMAKMGATDLDYSLAFDVQIGTVRHWRVIHQDFRDATMLNKEATDDNIERSLYERAHGYSFEMEEIFCNDGDVTRVTVVKHVPPDPTAMIWWLKNRRHETWKDRKEIAGTGDDGELVITVRGGLPDKKK